MGFPRQKILASRLLLYIVLLNRSVFMLEDADLIDESLLFGAQQEDHHPNEFENEEDYEANQMNYYSHQQLIPKRPKGVMKPTRTVKYTFSRLGTRSLPFNGIKARKMPCCTETIGTHTCNELRNRRPLAFRKRCKADADFAILQCCQTCRTNVSQLGADLFAAGLKSRHCFDRHNRNYCAHFIHQSGMWAANAGKLVNCNGESASLAFRVCRRSCGFCEPELYNNQNKACTKGSGVNPTVKGGKLTGNEKAGKGTTKRPREKEIVKESGTTKNPPSATTFPSSAPTPSSTPIETPITNPTDTKPTITENPTNPPPSPPKTALPTLRPTFIPPTTPKLLPCPSPPPLPPLPSIPCRPEPPPPPLPTLAPLTQATLTVPQEKPRPFVPARPEPIPLPPIRPIMPPLVPRPMPRPIPVSRPRPPPYQPFAPKPVYPGPQRPPPKITIEWKPMPPPHGTTHGGSEVGPWPEWPWPLPDEVIEALLNHLSGIGLKSGGGWNGNCKDCVYDEEDAEVGMEQQQIGNGEVSDEVDREAMRRQIEREWNRYKKLP